MKIVAEELRAIAKALIKGALYVYDATKDVLAEAGEQFEDLMAEARAQVKKGKRSKPDQRQKS